MASSNFPRPAGERNAQVVVGLGIVGLEPDRLLVMRDGPVDLPAAGEGQAQIVVCGGIVGADLQCPPTFGHGVVELPPTRQGQTEIVMRVRVPGLICMALR